MVNFIKQYLVIISLFFINNSFAQTTIDDIEEGSYLQIGATYNSRIAFAGQSLGINGSELMPALTYVNKNGLFANVSTSTYTNKTILKNAPIAEEDIAFGYIKRGEIWESANFYNYSKLNFGNAFFKKFLNNAIGTENCFHIGDHFDINANAMYLFGKKIKKKSGNNSVVLESNLEYHTTFEEVLGAEQISISTNLSYFFGSDKLISSFLAKDTISENNAKVLTNNTMNTLSFVPNININYQKQHNEIILNVALPIARIGNNFTNGIATNYITKTQQPIFTISYNYYIGKGLKQ